jgi:AGZA family xanthine/uracil permease-like MFS transporter
MGTLDRLERYFEFEALGTNWKTETLAGVTTFLTMAYIVFVNPSILRDAGIPPTAAAAATCISAAFGSLVMGFYARYPIALAPGMGLNAYFTYTVVIGMGVSWQAALGAVFLSGVIFLVLTVAGIRQLIISTIPASLYHAIAAGIGLFIALIGFRNAGLIVSNEATTVSLGQLSRPETALALFGLLLIAALLAWRVKAAMLIGIVGTTLLALATGLAQWGGQSYNWTEATTAAFELDVSAAMSLGFWEIVFVFLFVDFFDNVGTLIAVGTKAKLFRDGTDIPRIQRILVADASATMVGACAGTSTVVSYIESAAGVAVGGRSGFTAVVTGVLFLAALFVAPLVGAIPAAATAPALIIVGSMMMTAIRDIDWDDPVVSIPAFLTITMIPLSFSIADGLAIGFVAYTALKVLSGEYKTVNWLVYVLTALFIARFVYLGGE